MCLLKGKKKKKKRMIVPSGHSGITKSSYVSFYNKEAKNSCNEIELGENGLFNIGDWQYKKILKTAKQ